jgi:tRNA (guanine10-N2)-dimethyltransferase
MVKGCGKNLSSLGINDAKLFCKDIGRIGEDIGNVDAIATDPPYGKSATTNREEIDSLYARAFKGFSEILQPKGYLSIAIPEKELIETGKEFLDLVESHAFRVHRSLTRNFCVYRKE